jgi:hypothetical protein
MDVSFSQGLIHDVMRGRSQPAKDEATIVREMPLDEELFEDSLEFMSMCRCAAGKAGTHAAR